MNEQETQDLIRWIDKLTAERDAAERRAEAAEARLIESAGFDVADLMRALDDCTIRAEAAERAVARVRELVQLNEGRLVGPQYHRDILAALDGPAAPKEASDG